MLCDRFNTKHVSLSGVASPVSQAGQDPVFLKDIRPCWKVKRVKVSDLARFFKSAVRECQMHVLTLEHNPV